MNCFRTYNKLSLWIVLALIMLITVGTNAEFIKLKLQNSIEIVELIESEIEKELEKEFEKETKLLNHNVSNLFVCVISNELSFQPFNITHQIHYFENFTPPPELV